MFVRVGQCAASKTGFCWFISLGLHDWIWLLLLHLHRFTMVYQHNKPLLSVSEMMTTSRDHQGMTRPPVAILDLQVLQAPEILLRHGPVKHRNFAGRPI